jgi:hypothetical protein
MNNTTVIAAIFIAAALVVGTLATATTQSTQSAFAYSPKKDDKRDGKDGGNGNGNTVTIQKCKQAATQSGFDNSQAQECENLICTHPGENATCVQEGAVTTNVTTPPVKLTCEQCITSLLTPEQISRLGMPSIVCGEASILTIERFEEALTAAGVSASVQAQLIQCLLDAGITFATTPGLT